MYKFKLADIAEGLESGKIVEFFVKEGDQVTEGQDVFLVETDKVSTEISAPVNGKVVKIYFQPGAEVRVGEVVMDIDDGQSDHTAVRSQKTAPAATQNQQPAASVVGSVTVSDEVIPPPSTQQATSPVSATPLAHKIAHKNKIDLTHIQGTGTNNKITSDDLSLTQPAASVVGSVTVSDEVIPPSSQAVQLTNNHAIKATPFLRKQAANQKINLTNIQGSGPDGRIIMTDLNRLVAEQKPTSPITNFFNHQNHSVTPVPLTNIRRAIARQMVLAKTKIPETTLMREANITKLVKLRASLKEEAAQQNVKLTFMAFFIRACCVALRQIPIVNSSLDDQKNTINYKNFINIGVAVDTPSGLVVPVIFQADQKSILKIASEVVDLATRARERKLKLTEMKNGTFTISNYGSVGIEFATPVINYPEVAILGIGSIIKKPVLDASGQVVAGSVVPLSLTIDHRVIDGADGARFLSVLINLLETPTKLLLI